MFGLMLVSAFVGRELMCDRNASWCPKLRGADEKGNLTSAEKTELKECDAEEESKLFLLYKSHQCW